MTRVFLNAPAMRTREDVERYCERLGVVHTAGYRAVDGLRVMVELPEVAMDGVANEARAIERRAKLLRARAETVLTSESKQSQDSHWRQNR